MMAVANRVGNVFHECGFYICHAMVVVNYHSLFTQPFGIASTALLHSRTKDPKTSRDFRAVNRVKLQSSPYHPAIPKLMGHRLRLSTYSTTVRSRSTTEFTAPRPWRRYLLTLFCQDKQDNGSAVLWHIDARFLTLEHGCTRSCVDV